MCILIIYLIFNINKQTEPSSKPFQNKKGFEYGHLPYRECNLWKQHRCSQKLLCKEEEENTNKFLSYIYRLLAWNYQYGNNISIFTAILPSHVFHHVSWNWENLDWGAFGDLLLSFQLLDGVYDLLGFFNAHFDCMAEVRLLHILSRCLNHHWWTIILKIHRLNQKLRILICIWPIF